MQKAWAGSAQMWREWMARAAATEGASYHFGGTHGCLMACPKNPLSPLLMWGKRAGLLPHGAAGGSSRPVGWRWK